MCKLALPLTRWLEGTANVRRHGTTRERPQERFERDERGALGPLARGPYRRVGSPPRAAAAPASPPPVAVQQRPLQVYAEVLR